MGITPPVLDQMTFFQIGILTGADLDGDDDADEEGEMRLIMNRKTTTPTATVVDASGAVGKIS